MEIAMIVLDVLMKIGPKLYEIIKKEIDAGKVTVDELRKKPLDYFVTKAAMAIKAQAEAESHLPD